MTLWLIHDVLSAFDAMAQDGRLYQMMKDRSLGRDYIKPFAKAAVRFTIQVAIECGHEVSAMRDMEDQLTAALDKGL